MIKQWLSIPQTDFRDFTFKHIASNNKSPLKLYQMQIKVSNQMKAQKTMQHIKTKIDGKIFKSWFLRAGIFVPYNLFFTKGARYLGTNLICNYVKRLNCNMI